MRETADNYRVEIKLLSDGMPHDWFVAVWLEMAEEIKEHLHLDPSRTSLVWSSHYFCENCGEELDYADDEIECSECGQLMCMFCNCGTESSPLCETCLEEERRSHDEGASND